MTATAETVRPSATSRSTTDRGLRRLRLGLLAAALAALVGSLLASQGVRGAADAVGTGTAPSIAETVTAREALVAAEAAVIRSFETGEVRLAGPGVEYQNQMAIASQSLARIAEHNLVGEAASQRIQLVQGLLVAYMGLVGQADAHYRAPDGGRLGLVYLWYASRLLHMPSDGILEQLDQLREENERLLAAQVSGGWMNPLAALLWLVPMLLLLALLTVAMVFLSRRFRRTLNVPLLIAGVVSLLAIAVASFSFIVDARLDAAREHLAKARDVARTHTDVAVADGRQSLAALLRNACGSGETACRETVVDAFRLFPVGDPSPAAAVDSGADEELTARMTLATGQTAAAGRAAGLAQLAPLAAATVAVLLLVGLEPRIDEYRYRSR